MISPATERILRRMDRMGFAGAGEALAEIERLRTDYALLSDDYKQLLGDVERLRDVIDRAAKAWLSLEPGVAWEGDVGGAMKAAVAEIERLRGIVGLESDDLDLDWDRLRSGDQRALIADHQDVFNMMFDLQAEIERLRGLLALAGKSSLDFQKFAEAEFTRLRGLLREWLEGGEEGADTFEQRVREALGE